VQVGVLGPLEVVTGADRVALGGPKQRLVLGLLAAWRGRVVTVDELIDGLWPEGPQDQPRKTVQVYITRLRRALATNGDVIRSEAAGYVLDRGLLTVDADVFHRTVREAAARNDDRAAIADLRGALGLWRGDAFADLRESPAIVPSAVQLDELRLTARHELFEREIRIDPRHVIAELEEAVEANPLDEGFAAQLMTAQYRAGRQADALATYQTLRRRLAEELGLDPGPAVRELEGRILRHELEVAAPPTPREPERQRRVVSVVAAELKMRAGDAPLDPEEELAITDPVHRAARARLRDGGGVVLAQHGDTLSACFGYPSTERSVERAVLAALALGDIARSTSEQVDVRVGVDTGVVVVESPAEDGGGSSVLTGIAGPPLRIAARLAQAGSDGEVLVGPTTAAAVDDRFQFAPPAGLSDVEGAVAVVGPAARSDRGGSLLGRETVRRELAEIADRAGERLYSLAITGPPGVGKSAVVDAFLTELDPSWSVVRLHCDPRQSVTPLHPFRAVLPELFAAESEPSTRLVVATLAERWAGASPVIVVEDLHAADPSTLELLGDLPQRVPTGLVLLTSRGSDPIELGGDVVPRLALGPLDRATTRLLAVEVAAPTRLDLATLKEIVDRSGGVPLYVRALTRAVVDGSTAAGPARVPTSLYDSLMSGLDRLGPARPFAQRCAVLGESFSLDDIALVDPEGAADGEHLATAIEAGLITDSGDGRFRFTHALVADAAYDSLLHSERAALHDQIATGMPAQLSRSEPERLAYHLEAAGRTFEAAVEWRRASANAIRRARHREAYQHARRAVQLLDRVGPDSVPQGDATRIRAPMNLAIGLQATRPGSEELLAVVTEARASGADRHDLGRRILLDMIDISSRQALGDLAGATTVAGDAVVAAEAADDELWRAFARQFLGATLVWRGDLQAGVERLEQASGYWERADEPGMLSGRPVGALWAALGLAAYFADRPADAERYGLRARDAIPAEDDYGRCLVALTAAVVDQLADRPDIVRCEVEPVWSLAMDQASDFWLTWAQVMLGWSIAADGEATGLSMMAEAIDGATTRQTMPYFDYLLGSRSCQLGQEAAGLARLEQGLELAAATGEELWTPLLHLERARWLEHMAQRDAATEAADRASERADAMGAAMVSRRVAEWRARRSPS
jgi:DNA-binding SARP family transcriptional activator